MKVIAKPVSKGILAFTYLKEGKGDIYAIDFSKGEAFEIAKSDSYDEYPSVSPDGKKVAFYSDRSGDREIFVSSIDSKSVNQITSSKGADEDPEWSPDGKKIVFSSARSGGQNLFLMESDGTDVRELTRGSKRNTVPRFSPDGKKIVYSTDANWPGWDVMEFDLGKKASKALTWGLRTNCRGSYSHDGKRLVYSYGAGKDIDLYIMESDGNGAVQLTDRPGKEYDGVWVSGDKGVFFAGELSRGKGDYQIFYRDFATGQVTQVTEAAGATRYLSFHD